MAGAHDVETKRAESTTAPLNEHEWNTMMFYVSAMLTSDDVYLKAAEGGDIFILMIPVRGRIGVAI